MGEKGETKIVFEYMISVMFNTMVMYDHAMISIVKLSFAVSNTLCDFKDGPKTIFNAFKNFAQTNNMLLYRTVGID